MIKLANKQYLPNIRDHQYHFKENQISHWKTEIAGSPQDSVVEKLDSMYRQRTVAEGFGEANTMRDMLPWQGMVGLSDRKRTLTGWAAYGERAMGKKLGNTHEKAMGEGLSSPHWQRAWRGTEAVSSYLWTAGSSQQGQSIISTPYDTSAWSTLLARGCFCLICIE